jgi:mycothiol synthase
VDRLSAGDVYEVMALTRAAGDADGAFPLSEHVTLHLRRGGDLPAVHLLARSGAELVGYAHVDTTDLVEGASAELCVHPLHRRRGLGRALVGAAMAAADALDSGRGAAARPAGLILAEVPDPVGRLRLWAHGDHPSASAMALSLGFTRSRVLWQMRRSLAVPVPAAELPPGVHLRPFRPGLDDAAWLDLNARAFADLPDQGRWTAPDLAARLAESWFDADGFLLAVRADATLAGFHWTKVHGGARHGGGESHHHEPIGEVYVLGVDPVAHGTGLGTTLTLAGLRHLRDRGLNQVMLYVDESNPQALALYRKLGFARWSTDVLFSRRA